MAIYYGDANGKAQKVIVVGKPGPQGPAGPQGAPGPQGPAGRGVPTGGTAGQVLTKEDGTDYNAKWKTPGFATIAQTEDYTVLSDGAIFLVFTNKQLIFGPYTDTKQQLPWGECYATFNRDNTAEIPVAGIPFEVVSNSSNITFDNSLPDGANGTGWFEEITVKAFMSIDKIQIQYYIKRISSQIGSVGGSFHIDRGSLVAILKKPD